MKSPFKFLDPYDLKDKDAFFGRDTETKELYNLVTKNRLTFVYGPSGAGKTSLVQCGLAGRFGGVDWLPVFVRRSEDINAALRRELGKALGLATTFEGELTEAIDQLFRRYLRPVYLIFDQFEELFILGQGGELDEHPLFYQTIADLLDADLPCRVLFIMREDYFGHLNLFEKTIPELYSRKLRVEPMNRESLREVVTGSARVYQIGFDDERRGPEQILDNILHEREALHMPYVQVYMHILYKEALRRQYPDAPENTEPLPVQFSKPVIDAVGPMGDVLGRFLKEQETSIVRLLEEQGFEPPPDVLRQVLDIFVTDEGTKVPIHYRLAKGGNPELIGKAVAQLAHLGKPLLAACVLELEKSRILRRSEDDFEIAHDTLAALVNQQRSVEQRQLLEIRARVSGWRREWERTGEYPSRKQLLSVDTFLPKVHLEEQLEQFIADAYVSVEREEQAELQRQQAELEKEIDLRGRAEHKAMLARRFSRIAVGVAALAIVLSVVAVQQYFAVQQARDVINEKNIQTEAAKKDVEKERDKVKTALEKFQKAEADKVWKDVEDILRRAESLNSRYPDQARGLRRDATRLLDGYRENDILQARRKGLGL